MKAVIPAAGMGTRFLPYTRSQPKEMLPVVDKPAIQYVVEEAIASGLRELLIVTARGKRAIEDHFDRNIELEQSPANAASRLGDKVMEEILRTSSIYYVRQREHGGLGQAIAIAEKYTESQPFSVLLGDDITVGSVPCQRALIEAHRKLGVSVVAVQDVPVQLIGRYGMVVGKACGEGLFLTERIVEKPTPTESTSSLAVIGRYVLTPAVYDALREVRPDVHGEIQLTEAIGRLLRKEDVYALRFQGRRYDIGDKIGWLVANIEIGLRREDIRVDLERAVRECLVDNRSF